jgi:hypothetical protein
VSKDFDATLSAAIDLAAAAAQTGGAPAARNRGRKRTVHKRIAASTASAALVAVAATAAFEVSSPHGGTPQLASTGPRVTATASPGPTADPSASASASPDSGPTSPTVSGSPSFSPAITADPHQAVEAAWLAPAQMPFADIFHWKIMHADPQGASPIGQPLTAAVFYVAKETTFQALTMCGDPAELLGRTTGAQHVEFTTSSEGSGNDASQFVFFFTDAASAQQTFTWLQSKYGPSCPGATGMTFTKTADGGGHTSVAWLSRKGASGPVDASAYNREYFVQRGSTIAYVSMRSNMRSLPTAYDDTAQLSTIAAHLCVYGGPCD